MRSLAPAWSGRAATAELALWGQKCSLGPSVGSCSGHNLVGVSWLPWQPLLSALPTFSTHSDPRSQHSLLGDRQNGWREWRLWDVTLLEGVVVSFSRLIWAHGFGVFSLCSVGSVAIGSGSTLQKGCSVDKTTPLTAKEWERVGFHNLLGGQTPSDLKTSHQVSTNLKPAFSIWNWRNGLGNSRSKLWKPCEIEVALGFSRSFEGTVFLPLCCQMWCGEEDASPL